MYVKEDQKHKEICTQVEQIQAELANLTVIEMTKKDLKASRVWLAYQNYQASKQKFSLRDLTFVYGPLLPWLSTSMALWIDVPGLEWSHVIADMTVSTLRQMAQACCF